eukprot:TRINITY_DN3519_c0_g2_i2.p1 TRINITY_DN3519_c0_g2~~TRINITY_DN3519_c0_g2_i2.p1  ORF type:complete len:343 (-),score=85.20 TRINITY_DN3519_c0_g2_i2:29-1057(-)
MADASPSCWCAPLPDSSYAVPSSKVDTKKWREEGYSLATGIIEADLVNSVANEVKKLAPNKDDFGGLLYPVRDAPALNSLVLHPVLLQTVSELLGTSDIRLTQADAWSKTGQECRHSLKGTSDTLYSNQDQRIHIDAHNHTFVVPPDWNSPVSVAMIVYLSDFVGGGTGVVPREGDSDEAYQPGVNLMTPGGAVQYPWINDRHSAEEWMRSHDPNAAAMREKLYRREKVVKYDKGTVLFYRHDIWHRGRPVNPGATRIVLNLSFKRADCDFWPSWNQGWPQSNYDSTQFMERIIANSSVEQRNALGFPKPGHSYWNESTLKLVEARYKLFGFDISPYRNAIK